MAIVQLRNKENTAGHSMDIKVPKEIQQQGKEASIKWVNERPELQEPFIPMIAYDITLDGEMPDMEEISKICNNDSYRMLWYIASHWSRNTAMSLSAAS